MTTGLIQCRHGQPFRKDVVVAGAMCECCGASFVSLPGFPANRCQACVLDAAVQQYQYEVTG